jgi:hypothetical protein
MALVFNLDWNSVLEFIKMMIQNEGKAWWDERRRERKTRKRKMMMMTMMKEEEEK